MRRLKRRWTLRWTAAGLLVLAGLAGAQGKNPYARGRTDRLGRTLKTLQMGTLLEYLAQQTDDKGLLVDALLNQARATTDLQAKDRLFSQAAGLLKQRYETLEEAMNRAQEKGGEAWETATIEYYKARVRYIEVQVLNRAQPYIDRLAFLLAGEEDLKKLRELASSGADELDELQTRLKRLLIGLSGNPEALVYLVPELEEVQNRVKYNGAKVRYYAAVVEPRTLPDANDPEATRPNRRRVKLLEKAIEDFQPFADNPDYGVQNVAYLFQGRCYRELARFDKAAAVLDKAATASADSPVLVEVLFEIARNRTEQGSALIRENKPQPAKQAIDQAEAAIKTFAEKDPAVHPQVGVDFKKLILSYYLYENWADALRAINKPDLAAKVDRRGQQAFVEFLNKYRGQSDIRMAAAKMFQRKLEGRDVDPTTMDPVIVGLLAELEFNDARILLQGRSPADLPAEAQAEVREHFAKAKKLLEAIRASETESAKLAVPDALWTLGVIYVYELDNFKAGERFRELVERFPDHVNAKQAALNSVKIAEQLILLQMDAGKPVSRERRLQLVESIRLLLKHWPDDPQAAQYHAQLAGQCEQLAVSAENIEAWRKWINEAIQHYDMVPKDHPRYREAQFYGLELRWKLLEQMPQETPEQQKARLAAARELRKQLLAYGMKAHELWQQAEAKDRKADLGRWGSTAEFRAELIGYEMLGMQEDSLAKIEKLPARWPGTAILQESQEYLIRKLLAKGEVNKALGLFNDFRGKYGDEAARGLMRVVVENLQRTIQNLLAEGGNARQLAQYRKAYLDFADQVYQAQIGSAEGAEKYEITSLLADALVQSDQENNARRALQLYQQLFREDQARRKQAIERIRKDIARRMQAIDQAGSRIDALRKLPGLVKQALQAYDIDPGKWDTAAMADLRYAAEQLDNDQSPMDRDERVARLVQATRNAFQALQKQLEADQAVNAQLLLGLARSHQQLGQYAEALKLYRQLDAGLNPSVFPQLYWEVQLAIAQTTLAMNKDKPAEMKKLNVLIEQLRDIDENLGGRRFLGRFNRIQAEARRIGQSTGNN